MKAWGCQRSLRPGECSDTVSKCAKPVDLETAFDPVHAKPWQFCHWFLALHASEHWPRTLSLLGCENAVDEKGQTGSIRSKSEPVSDVQGVCHRLNIIHERTASQDVGWSNSSQRPQLFKSKTYKLQKQDPGIANEDDERDHFDGSNPACCRVKFGNHLVQGHR